MASNYPIVKVNFYEDTLDAVQDDGKVWVSLKRCCEPLGLDVDTQRRKLKKEAWACTVIMTVHDNSGRRQELLMVELDSLPMWLATINAGKVAEEVRPKLTRYQKEAARVLADHFFGRRATTVIPAIQDSPYTRRLKQSFVLTPLIPTGYWSVFVEAASFLIYAEQAFAAAGLEMDPDDLLDGSVGHHWAAHRRGKPWAVDSLKYPHTFPGDIPSGRAGKTFPVNCYHECELLEFRRWLLSEYSGTHFCSYLMSKYKKTPQKVTAALGHVRVMLAQKSTCLR